MNVKVNDNVLVIAGKDKGVQGKVLATSPKANTVTVEGVRIQKKHQKARRANETSKIAEVPGAIDAIALLEVQAMVAAIAGLDAMVKAADVKLIHVEKRLGGRLVTVVVEGEVSAVKAALEAGARAAAEVGNVKVCEVIARPHPDVMRFLTTG